MRCFNISDNKIDFDQESLFNYVNLFSFPRLTGTEGEKKAVTLTEKTFREIGFAKDKIIKQNFVFSDFYSTTLVKLIMTIELSR